MDLQEFSDKFDLYYNNITSNQAPGLNEWEKSVFLTKSEKEIVKNYFTANSKGNNIGQGFDDSAKRQADFACLLKTFSCQPVSSQIYTFTYNNTNPTTTVDGSADVFAVKDNGDRISPDDEHPITITSPFVIDTSSVNTATDTFGMAGGGSHLIMHGMLSKINYTTEGLSQNNVTIATKNAVYPEKLDPRSKMYMFPSDVFIIINEILETEANKVLQVIPLRYDEYTRLMSKPFQRPLKNQAWRLINSETVNASNATKYVETITNTWDTTKAYKLRYVRTPKPIILAELGTLSIDGIHTPTPCELDPNLHEDILQRAVELAKIAWTTTGQDNTQLVMQAGQRSE